MGSARADQREPLRQLEWIEPKATPGATFRGALMVISLTTKICCNELFPSEQFIAAKKHYKNRSKKALRGY
jgi:hypothetical protein